MGTLLLASVNTPCCRRRSEEICTEWGGFRRDQETSTIQVAAPCPPGLARVEAVARSVAGMPHQGDMASQPG